MASELASARGARAIVAAGIALSVALSAAPTARAQAKDSDVRRAARDLAREGARRYEVGDWEGARVLFERAYRIVPAPTIALREGRALVRLGRLVEAADAYARAASTPLDASSPEPFRSAVSEAQQALVELRLRIPKVSVMLVGIDRSAPGLEIALDGQAMPATLVGFERPLAPGPHVIEASVSGRHVVETVTLREGETRMVALRLDGAPATPANPPAAPPPEPDAPSSPPNPWTAVGWTAVASGAVGVGLGVVSGLLAVSRKDRLDAECAGSACPPSASDDLSAYRTFRTASTVGYVAGGIAAASGITILLLSSRARRAEPSVRVSVQASGAEASCRF